MKIIPITAALSLAFTGAAFAQDWNWPQDREHGFYEHYSRTHKPVAVAPGFNLSIGGVVPETDEVYEAPSDYDYAPAREYRYRHYGNRVYVVHPKTRKVVHIIEN